MPKLHKMVNGKRVDLTEKEEEEVRAEWKENTEKSNEERLRKKVLAERKRELKLKLAENLGVDVSEIDLLIGKADELLGN